MLVPLFPSHSWRPWHILWILSWNKSTCGCLTLHQRATPGFPLLSIDRPFSSVFWSEVAQSCLISCNPMDGSPPGSCVHGIFQTIILKWVAISFSRGSPQLRDWTWVSCIAGRLFTIWDTRDSIYFGANQIFPIHWALAVSLFQVSQSSHTIIFLYLWSR